MVVLSSVAEDMGLTHQQSCTVILNHKSYMMMVNTLFSSKRAETCYDKHCGVRGKKKCVAA